MQHLGNLGQRDSEHTAVILAPLGDAFGSSWNGPRVGDLLGDAGVECFLRNRCVLDVGDVIGTQVNASDRDVVNCLAGEFFDLVDFDE